jgi:hypothetical protein
LLNLGFVNITFYFNFRLISVRHQDRVLLQGLEWGSSKAVDKLKKMLWGLEALRVFDDRLSASLSQIQKAREAMERTIKQVGLSASTGIPQLTRGSGVRRPAY